MEILYIIYFNYKAHLNMENAHIVMKITRDQYGVYHVTLIKQQDGQVEIKILTIA